MIVMQHDASHGNSNNHESLVGEEHLRRLCKELTMKRSEGSYDTVDCIVMEIEKLTMLRTAAVP